MLGEQIHVIINGCICVYLGNHHTNLALTEFYINHNPFLRLSRGDQFPNSSSSGHRVIAIVYAFVWSHIDAAASLLQYWSLSLECAFRYTFLLGSLSSSFVSLRTYFFSPGLAHRQCRTVHYTSHTRNI